MRLTSLAVARQSAALDSSGDCLRASAALRDTYSPVASSAADCRSPMRPTRSTQPRFTLRPRALMPISAARRDCYCSPILAAGAGSTHGYDISDHGALNPELGITRRSSRAWPSAAPRTNGAHRRLRAQSHGHRSRAPTRGGGTCSRTGRARRYARFFDIDWRPVKAELRDKVLLPILGDQYGACSSAASSQLDFEDGALIRSVLRPMLPINPRQYAARPCATASSA